MQNPYNLQIMFLPLSTIAMSLITAWNKLDTNIKHFKHFLRCSVLKYTIKNKITLSRKIKHLCNSCWKQRVNILFTDYWGRHTCMIIKLHTEVHNVKTPLLCPVSVLAHEPSCMDQIFSLRSAPPLSTTTPDGKNLQLYTSPMCPSRIRYNHKNTWIIH